MTRPDTDLDPRTVTALQPPCEAPGPHPTRPPCRRPATWVVWVRHRGESKPPILVCDPHKERALRHVAECGWCAVNLELKAEPL